MTEIFPFKRYPDKKDQILLGKLWLLGAIKRYPCLNNNIEISEDILKKAQNEDIDRGIVRIDIVQEEVENSKDKNKRYMYFKENIDTVSFEKCKSLIETNICGNHKIVKASSLSERDFPFILYDEENSNASQSRILFFFLYSPREREFDSMIKGIDDVAEKEFKKYSISINSK